MPKDDDAPEETENVFGDHLRRNGLRGRILEQLDRQPGMNRHQLAVALDAHVNSIIFHVGRLLDQKVLESRPGSKGRETLLFPAHLAHLWDNPSTRVLFGRGPPRELAEYIAKNPGSDSKQAAEALDLSIFSVRRHIRLLEENNLVERFRIEREVIYRAAPELTDWLRETARALDAKRPADLKE